MATSKLMASSSSTSQTSDVRRNTSSATSPSSSSTNLPAFFRSQNRTAEYQGGDRNPNSNLMTLDRFLEDRYGDHQVSAESDLLNAESQHLDAYGDTLGTDPGVTGPVVRKTVDDVFREIMEGKGIGWKNSLDVECKEEAMDEMMTLEDFLLKVGAVDEYEVEPVRTEVKIEPFSERFSGESIKYDSPILTQQHSMESFSGFGNTMEVNEVGISKRRVVLEPLDKAALQRQRRMIKNRESAARSRERKQAYQDELESLATRLEEENEQLLREQAERTKERLKQLLENIVPVTERRRPARVLRRVSSMQL